MTMPHALAKGPPRIRRSSIIRAILMTDTEYLNLAEALLRSVEVALSLIHI